MKLFLTLLFCSSTLFAHEHREHGAHAHGAGTLGIAFDGAKGKMDFKIPSDSIFGFEYTPKSEADKKKKQEGLKKLETAIAEMVVFDPALHCKITVDKIEVVAESAKHSDTVAGYNISCDKSPVTTDITFNFQQQFPKIKDLDVQVIADNIQKSVEANKNKTKLTLK